VPERLWQKSNQFYGPKVKKLGFFCAMEHLCAIIRKNTGFNIASSPLLTLSHAQMAMSSESLQEYLMGDQTIGTTKKKVECLVLNPRQCSRDFKIANRIFFLNCCENANLCRA
jgi:hypothetical protein